MRPSDLYNFANLPIEELEGTHGKVRKEGLMIPQP